MENNKAISLVNISKSFGSVIASNKISLDVYKGEILALLGENGSGKTSLMNILSGIYYPDEGQVFVDGKPVTIASPHDAFDLGIGMVHQHFKLVDVLTATENIILGLNGNLNIKEARKKILNICNQYGFVIDPDKKIYNMSVSEKQTVEIVKVLYRGAQVLILDEPTAVLTPQETDKLFNVVRNMKKDGKSIIIITHKLNEVLAISDRVGVLRKGEYIGDLVTANTNAEEMTNMMVGRQVELNIDRPNVVNPKLRISVKNLNVKDEEGIMKIKDVSFDMFGGEIFGIAGISGCGQKELLEAIAGLQKIESGQISYFDDDGTESNLVGLDPIDIQKKGVALSFVPEDRLGMGLVANMNISDNMMLRTFRSGGSIFADRKNPTKTAQDVVETLKVVTSGLNTPVRRLSGGNVQKVLVGREISNAPKVLMTAYAVRGLDINSSYMIYDLLNEQKKKGTAVLFVGEDLDVLLKLSDRVLVLCDGQVSGILDGRKTDKNEVGLMMTSLHGGKDNA